MKITVTIIPSSLVTSSLSSLSCPFIETKNMNQIFSKLVVWLQEIVLLFVYSDSRSTLKVGQIQWTFIEGFYYISFLLHEGFCIGSYVDSY